MQHMAPHRIQHISFPKIILHAPSVHEVLQQHGTLSIHGESMWPSLWEAAEAGHFTGYSL
jgi:hypothetical protein